MLVELLRAGSPELARRWVAALMLVPEDRRQGIVEAVERQIVEEYGGSAPGFAPGRAGPDA